ncbi:MAG: L,D-transpeptidase family protein [Haloechinothrix sp.]
MSELGQRPLAQGEPATPGKKPRSGIAALAVAGLVVAAVVVVTGPAAAPDEGHAPARGAPTAPVTTPTSVPPPQPTPIAARQVSPDALARLPKATTFGTVTNAPADPRPGDAPPGMVVHPRRTVPVFTAPGGRPIAALPATQLGSDTWLPVLDEQPGWLRVLLPARPNGATGWLHHDTAYLRIAHTPYRIEVDRARFTLRLYRDGATIGRWTVGVGKPAAETPAGRTFVLASIRDTKATFSDIVLPLGAHSDTYTTYGGGPGTVGIHTWPTSDAFGTASSDGCIRVPPAALAELSTTVPLGTPVLIR